MYHKQKNNDSSEYDEPYLRSKSFMALDSFRNKKYKQTENTSRNCAEQVELDIISENRRIRNEKNYNQQDDLENFRQTFRYYVNKSVHEDQGRRYLGSGYPTPSVSSGATIDIEKLDLIIRCNKIIFTKLSKEANVWSFLSQFDDIAPAYNLNERELNILIFNLMADELKSKYMKAYAKHPKDISSKEFYSNVISIVIGHPATYSSMESKFNEYDPSKVGQINEVVNDLNKILDNIPPQILTEKEKERKLFHRIFPLLPCYLQPEWNNLLLPSRINEEELVEPSREIQRGFVSLYAEPINHNLNKIMKYKSYVVEEKKTEVKVNYRNPCLYCKRRGHLSEKCFLHPDPDIAQQNIKEHHCCVHCRSYNHVSADCHLYKDNANLTKSCQICERYGVIALHNKEDCVGVSPSYIEYLEKIRREKN